MQRWVLGRRPTLLRGAVRLGLGLIVLLCLIVPVLPQQPAEIAALLEKDSKVYNITLDRFRELSQQGARSPVSVVPYLLDADLANGPDLVAKIQAKHSRLIFAIGNNAAQGLYLGLGFISVGLRKAYYGNEDADVLRLPIPWDFA